MVPLASAAVEFVEVLLFGVEQSQEVAVDDTPAIRSVGMFSFGRKL